MGNDQSHDGRTENTVQVHGPALEPHGALQPLWPDNLHGNRHTRRHDERKGTAGDKSGAQHVPELQLAQQQQSQNKNFVCGNQGLSDNNQLATLNPVGNRTA